MGRNYMRHYLAWPFAADKQTNIHRRRLNLLAALATYADESAGAQSVASRAISL